MSEKGRAKIAKRKSEEEMIFEAFRILTPLVLPDWDSFDGYNSSRPFATTEKKLSEVCAWNLGGGDYVAFQLSESGEGLPLSYWVIKVRDRERHNSMRVYPREDLINILREEYKPSGLIESLFFRRYLAAITSLCLRELEEPKAKKSKETPPVKRAKELIRHYGSRSKDKVIAQLITEAKKLWERGIASNPEAVERNAKAAYESAKRSKRARGTRQKAITTGRKTRRT